MQNWNDLIRTQLNNLASFPAKQTWKLGEWTYECHVRPEVANFAALPLVGNELGDVRVSLADQAWYIWDGAAWQSMGGGGGGAVNSVTASAPIASSGGANPNISLTGIVPAANGGTGIAAPGVLGNVLTSNGAGAWTSSAPASTSPAAPLTSVQFNNGGAFGGSAGLTWNGSTLAVDGAVDRATAGTLTVGGTTATAITVGSAGITTSFPGPVNLTGDVTTVGGTQFTTDATFDGNVTFGNAASDNISFVGQVDTAITQEGIAAPAVSPASTGRIYFDSGTNTFKASQNGGAYVDIITGGTVTSVTLAASTTGLTVSGGASQTITTSGTFTLGGTLAVANGGTGTSTAFTPGSVVFAGASGVYSQDNANLFWDDTNNRLGIGTATPSTTLHVNSGAVNGTAIATLQNTAGDFQVFRVDANPEGSVTGSIGDIADDSTNGVVYVKTSGSATNTGWSPLANLGTKVYLVVEGGQYATIQAAIDATPTGTNIVPAYSVILVGPKANTGGGASGSWGPAVLAANKSLMITGLGGAQTAKDIRIDSLTFDSSAAGLDPNLNENYVSGLFINSSSVTSVVTFGGTGAIRLRLNNCYVYNNGAGDAVTNTNSNVNGSLYLDTCIVSVESTTGIAVRSSGYTVIRNRSEVNTIAGGTNLSTGRSLSASAGVVEIYDSYIGGAGVPRPIVELTGTAFLLSGYTTISNPSNDVDARCVFVNSATATFASGDTFLYLGSSLAAAGQVVSGTGTFNFGNITFAYSPLLTVTTQTPALRTGGWFTTDIKEGISLTSPGNPLFNLNSSGQITRYNDAALTNGQVLIGDTAAGYLKAATLTAGSGISITNGAGAITIAATGGGGTITGSGTATQIAFFTGASAIGSETAVGSNSFTWDATNNRLGVGTSTPAHVVDVQAGSLAGGGYALNVDATLTNVGGTVVSYFEGSVSAIVPVGTPIYGVVGYLSGAGVPSTSYAGSFGNVLAGSGQDPVSALQANFALQGSAAGTTASGHNVGVMGLASNGARNYAVFGNTTGDGAGANVAVTGMAKNSSGIRIGGLFASQTTGASQPTVNTSAVLIADNMDLGDPIFLARDNGTTTFSIGNNGVVLAKNTTDSTTAFSVQDSSGNTLLGIDTVNDRVGVGGVAGASLTHTFNVGAGAANFCVGSGGRIHTYAGTAPTDGQVLIGDTLNGHFDKAALTAGAGISITNGAGSITIAATGAAASSSTDITGYVAQEALNAGDLVRFVNDAGTPKVQKADATNTDARLNPVGFAVAAALAGAAVTVRVAGVADVPAARFDAAPAVTDVGKRVFVSTTSGQITITAPSASGDVLQRAGVLVDGSGSPKVLVQVGDPTLL